MNKLEEARKIINEVDAQMAELFVKRMQAAELVFEHKKEFGLPIQDPAREAVVVEKNAARIQDEVLKGYYIDYIKHLMGLSRAYQYRLQGGLRVAYSGVEGAFAHIAAGRIFPGGTRIACRDFQAAYDSVISGENDVAVLPIENSYAGEVGQTIDLIFSGELFINGIYELEIHQNLLGVEGASIGDIRKVVSHPQALSQCHGYIQRHGFASEEANNTAFAAKMVAEGGDKSLAAIASAGNSGTLWPHGAGGKHQHQRREHHPLCGAFQGEGPDPVDAQRGADVHREERGGLPGQGDQHHRPARLQHDCPAQPSAEEALLAVLFLHRD